MRQSQDRPALGSHQILRQAKRWRCCVSGTLFATDIKNCMRDCILSVMWPRQQIVTFLRDNGCTSAELNDSQNFKELGLSRAAIVDRVFEPLSSRADGGLGQYRAMLQALLNWSHFDPYFFDTL